MDDQFLVATAGRKRRRSASPNGQRRKARAVRPSVPHFLCSKGQYRTSAPVQRVLELVPAFPTATWAWTNSTPAPCGTPTPSSPGSWPAAATPPAASTRHRMLGQPDGAPGSPSQCGRAA